jgi:hypothetical protein
MVEAAEGIMVLILVVRQLGMELIIRLLEVQRLLHR